MASDQPKKNQLRRSEAVSLLESHHAEIASFGVRSLFLFGSVARDEARPESDVDVLVDFDGAPTFEHYMGLKFCLEDLLGKDVDLVTRKGLKRRIRPEIEREAIRVA